MYLQIENNLINLDNINRIETKNSSEGGKEII